MAGLRLHRHPALRQTLPTALLALGLTGLAAARGEPGATATRAAGAPAAAAFADVTVAAGVDRPHRLRRFDNPYADIMAGYTALGAAVAVADVDGDGHEDLFVTDSAEDGSNRLYRNEGDFTFTEVAAAAGVAAGNDARNASADALFLDYDNDGLPDLLVVRFGQNQLFHNEGGGRFRDVTRGSGLERYANGITAVAFDYDRDGRVDLAVGNYFQPVDVFAPATTRFFPESFETASNGGGVTLWRNEGWRADGQVRFTDVTDRAGLRQSGWTLDLGAADADNDGDVDLFVATDFGTDRFFVNRGDGTFADRTAAALGYDTKKGMNAEWGDFDGDGWLDVYVTNITDDYMREGNFLWRNDGPAPGGGVTFSDLAAETGSRDTGWGWGAKFLDFDNDGWLDLYVLNGWVSAGPQSYVPDIFAMILRVNDKGGDFADLRDWPPMGDKSLSGYQKKRLFHNQRGQLFSEQAARHGLDSTRDGRGLAVVDLDADGRLDLFVANAGQPPLLYRNVQPQAAHWVELELEGTRSHRDALGAKVRLTAGGRTLLRHVDPGNGFGAQGTRRVHFGLGTARTIERVEVWWPSGLRQVVGGVTVDRLQRVVEGVPGARAVGFRPPAVAAEVAPAVAPRAPTAPAVPPAAEVPR